MPPGIVDGALLCIAHPVLYLGEGLLDRIEVWRIGGQEPEPGTGGFDQLPDCRRLMAGEIVHDDDVAWLEHRYQLLLDIGAKAFAIDWPVEDTGRSQPIVPQGTQECQRAPVAMWRKRPQTLSFWSPPPDRRHVGLDPGLIDEDQPLGIEVLLQAPPSLSSAGNIGTSLFKGEQRFF